MTVELPTWIVVAQWTLLIALGFLVVVMYRQMGYYLAATESGSEHLGLAVGHRVAEFDYIAAGKGAGEARRHHFGHGASLLVFVDPFCGGCERSIASLDSLSRSRQLEGVEVRLLTAADPVQVARTPALHEREDIALITADVMERDFRIERVPFAYLIDTDGTVRAKGIAETESAFRRLLRQVGVRQAISITAHL